MAIDSNFMQINLMSKINAPNEYSRQTENMQNTQNYCSICLKIDKICLTGYEPQKSITNLSKITQNAP